MNGLFSGVSLCLWQNDKELLKESAFSRCLNDEVGSVNIDQCQGLCFISTDLCNKGCVHVGSMFMLRTNALSTLTCANGEMFFQHASFQGQSLYQH